MIYIFKQDNIITQVNNNIFRSQLNLDWLDSVQALPQQHILGSASHPWAHPVEAGSDRKCGSCHHSHRTAGDGPPHRHDHTPSRGRGRSGSSVMQTVQGWSCLLLKIQSTSTNRQIPNTMNYYSQSWPPGSPCEASSWWQRPGPWGDAASCWTHRLSERGKAQMKERKTLTVTADLLFRSVMFKNTGQVEKKKNYSYQLTQSPGLPSWDLCWRFWGLLAPCFLSRETQQQQQQTVKQSDPAKGQMLDCHSCKSGPRQGERC